MKRKMVLAAALGAAAVVGLAACGGASASGNSSAAAGYNAGLTRVVNPSPHKGGTLTFAESSTPDSFDPGNTYYMWVINFDRLFTMSMFTYKSCPGSCGLQLVPDLATNMGTTSDHGLTWTFHIQSDVKFENGQVVTSQDVKYAIERSYARSVLPNGPDYYQQLLADPSYPGPYVDRAKNLMGLTSVDTPNPTTIVFHLTSPFPDFPYVLAFPNSAPVPPDKDTGANYQLHPMSTGPYMFQSYQIGKQLTMVPNPEWNPATDPNAKQLPSKIVVELNVNAADIDNRLMAGEIDVDALGAGVQTAARSEILSSPSLMANADDPVNGLLLYFYLNTKVAPLNNVYCRRAIEYAANKVTMQDASGGPVGGGAIASTVLPPNIIGYKSFDLYEALTKPTGDLVKAKQELALCGHPNGFSVAVSYRSDRPREVLGAEAVQASLARVGIKVTLLGFPFGTYYTDFAGNPAYVHSHDIGILTGSWGADWPDGYGFLYGISDGATISSSGNVNISELNDPVINNMFAKSMTLTGAARTALWSQIDRQIMKDAAILPVVYNKVLLYRPTSLTNVYVQAYYGEYNYAVLGVNGQG